MATYPFMQVDAFTTERFSGNPCAIIFEAEQGHWMRRPDQARVEVIGPPDDIEAVKVGEAAVTVLRGELV